jgi:acyl-CoA dehydrogenase
VRKGDRYVVNGQKVWISTAQVADKILLLARTTPLEDVKRPTEGLSLFYTDFDRSRITVHEIEKMGRKASTPTNCSSTASRSRSRTASARKAGLRIHPARHESRAHPDRRRSGGPRQVSRWSGHAYAKERIVFNRPIGQNQAIQHPLAKNWMELEAGWLMTMSAAWQYDRACRAARRPTPPNTWPARRASMPASRR